MVKSPRIADLLKLHSSSCALKPQVRIFWKSHALSLKLMGSGILGSCSRTVEVSPTFCSIDSNDSFG